MEPRANAMPAGAPFSHLWEKAALRSSGRMRDFGKAAGKFEWPPLARVSPALVVAKPRIRGEFSDWTFARKIPLFFKALDLERYH